MAGIEQELSAGADINARDEEGYTALMWAASKGQLPVVKHLREKGADITLRNENGRTAYKLAQNYGHYDIAAYLKPYVKRMARQVKRGGRKRGYVFNLGDCRKDVDVIKLARKAFYLRGWSDIRSTADTVDAVMKRRDTYHAKLQYNQKDSLVSIEYTSELPGNESWLVKIGKQVRKNYIKSCR